MGIVSSRSRPSKCFDTLCEKAALSWAISVPPERLLWMGRLTESYESEATARLWPN